MRLLVGQGAVDQQPAGVQQHVDLTVAGADILHHRGHLVAVAQVQAEVVRHAAGCLHRLDGPQRSLAALDAHDLVVDLLGRHLLAGASGLGDQRLLQGIAAFPEELDVFVIPRRRLHQVQQVEDAAGRAHRQIGGDGAGDAAGRAGDHEDGVVIQRHAGLAIAGRLLDQGDGVAQAVVIAHLDDAGVVERLGDQGVGRLGRLAAGLEVHHLDHHALPGVLRPQGLFHVVGLGEAADRAAQGGRRAGCAVAVQPAQPCGRHQEGVGAGHRVVERAHGGVEVLGPHPVGLAPLLQVHLLDGRLHVQRRQPVDALDRPIGQPAFELGIQRIGGHARLQRQRRRAQLLQPVDQRLAHAAAVQHHHHAAAAAQRHAGGLGEFDHRPQAGHRRPPRHLVRILQRADGGDR